MSSEYRDTKKLDYDATLETSKIRGHLGVNNLRVQEIKESLDDFISDLYVKSDGKQDVSPEEKTKPIDWAEQMENSLEYQTKMLEEIRASIAHLRKFI